MRKISYNNLLKKFCILLFAFCICASGAAVFSMTASAADGELSTTTIDGKTYYEIGTADDLYAFADLVNYGETSANAILTANITITVGTHWFPISDHDPYTGTFDGQGHIVSGLYFNDDMFDLVGLFGYVGEGGKVQNVGVVDSHIIGNSYVGGVVGINDGTVTNCYYTGTVSGSVYVGGVVGLNYGTVTNCYNYGTVGAADRVGGVVDTNVGTVTNCYYLADSDDGYGGKTTAQFASGEVAYLLGFDWGQTIGIDAYPVLGGLQVYEVTNCAGGRYSNTSDGSHFGGTATCTAAAVCNICKTAYGEVAHSTTAEGDKAATCGSKAYCSVCDSEYGEVDADNHTSDTYTNGFRDCCGAYEPAVDSDSDGYYEIGNLGQLMWFAENAASTKHNVILTADITIDNSVVWTPMTLTDGDANSSIFDGGGHTITFANTNEGSTFGLFGTYNYSFITNLKLAGSITCNTTNNVGVLVNSAYRTTISNVISTCNITNHATTGGTGGLAGQFGGQNKNGLYSLIENCAVYADVVGGGSAGGLIGNIWAGYQYCTVRNCAYVGNSQGTVNSGAIVGANGNNGSTSTFTNVYYCEKDGIGWVGSAGSSNPSITNMEAKTAEQFASGEVAYLLQSGVAEVDGTTPEIWGQDLTTDGTYPTLGGTLVTERCDFYGQQLNLGADLAMKYYVVAYGKDFDAKLLKVEFIFLGEKKEVLGVYDPTTGLYVFTLDGITPQCMGDNIYAKLYYGDDVKDTKDEYSVEKYLNNLLDENSDDAALVTLIKDTLAYGKAASDYKDHPSITENYTGSDREIPDTSVVPNNAFRGFTVVFGQQNYIKIGVNLEAGYTLYLNGEDVTAQLKNENTGDTYQVYRTAGIAATDFATVFEFEVKNNVVTVQTFSVSVNDYIGAQKNSETMGSLVKALYNYGASATGYANCKAGNHDWNDDVCTVCKLVCEHDWDDGICTVCELVCDHDWDNGICTVCEFVCTHKYENGVCKHCGFGGGVMFDPSQGGNTYSQGIVIPGIEKITIPVNATEVTVDFYNPEQNKDAYYLTFELRLPDGNGGYELLYKSELIEAGNNVQNITLSRGLAEGTYNAIVFVQPYCIDGITPTNNVKIETKLCVNNTSTNTDSISYVLTIPDIIKLATEESYLGTVWLEITELAEQRQVEVYISSPNYDNADDWDYAWHLLDEKGASKVPYTLKYGDVRYYPVDPDSSILNSTETGAYFTTLIGNVKESPAYAGNYKDTLTFTVSVLTTNTFWDSENITLTEDVTMVDDPVSFYSNKTLDLNGHTITGGTGINVLSGAKLTVNDSTGGGKVVDYAFASQNSGDIEINGGAFENNGYVVLVQNNANATINGGTFTNSFYNEVFSLNEATAEINGGTFNGNIKVTTNGILTINNGTVNGYLGLFSSGASITVNGGTFTGGIYIRQAGTQLIINGGTFTGGITVEDGADTSGVVINGGTFDFDPTENVDTTTHSVTDNGNGTWTVTVK